MLSASLLGTTLGDFVSVSMGLGYVRGLPLMLGLLGAVLLAERGLRIKTQSYYWAAVVITRTGATNAHAVPTASGTIRWTPTVCETHRQEERVTACT
jgi:uncharacterized membrane-anchored protein